MRSGDVEVLRQGSLTRRRSIQAGPKESPGESQTRDDDDDVEPNDRPQLRGRPLESSSNNVDDEVRSAALDQRQLKRGNRETRGTMEAANKEDSQMAVAATTGTRNSISNGLPHNTPTVQDVDHNDDMVFEGQIPERDQSRSEDGDEEHQEGVMDEAGN